MGDAVVFDGGGGGNSEWKGGKRKKDISCGYSSATGLPGQIPIPEEKRSAHLLHT